MEASRKQDLSDTFTENDPSSHASIRQVGIKSKREEDDDDDGTDWEQAPVAGNLSFQGDLSTSWNSVYMCLYKSRCSVKRIFFFIVCFPDIFI